MEDLFKHPSAISIFTEILVQRKITAAKLLELETITEKKTILYKRLNELERNNFIYSKKEQVEVQGEAGIRKYSKKYYYPNHVIIDAFVKGVSSLSSERPRDARLYVLYSVNSLIMREIQKYLVFTNEEVKDILFNNQSKSKANNLFYSTLLDLETKVLGSLVQQKMKEVVDIIMANKGNMSKLQKVKHKLENDSVSDEQISKVNLITPNPLFFYFAFFDYKDEFEDLLLKKSKKNN